MPGPTSAVLMHEMLLMSMLNRGQFSGYDLAQLLKEPIPLIWPVKHSQIYPVLSALESRGDLEGMWEEQRGRPSKKLYRLTDQGKLRLTEWLSLNREPLSRQEAILIAYNYNLVGAAASVSCLRTYRRQAENEIGQLEKRWAALTDGRDLTAWIGPRAAFEFGIMARRSTIAWCDWATAQIAEELGDRS